MINHRFGGTPMYGTLHGYPQVFSFKPYAICGIYQVSQGFVDPWIDACCRALGMPIGDHFLKEIQGLVSMS